jgi:hypothetical protein
MKPLTRYILLLSSLLTVMIPQKMAQACGFYVWPGEYRFWLLQPDLTNQPDLTPFFFASTYLYRQDITAGQEAYQQQNIEEWAKEINYKAERNDIDSLLNNTNPQDFFEREGKIVKQNSFLRFLKKPENNQLYRYIVISKKLEQVAGNPDPWGEEDNSLKPKFEKLINEAKALRQETRSPFLKLRTAYQLERLYSRNDQSSQVDIAYDAWIEPVKTDSWIKKAGLYQKAISKSGELENYLLSKVFDMGDYNRAHCLARFFVDEFDGTVRMAKNTHERNVLWAMKICKYPGRSLDNIKHIYQTEPSYKELPFLLLREINKVEDWLVTSKVTEFGLPAVHGTEDERYSYFDHPEENYKSDQAYAKKLMAFLLQVINDNKSNQRGLLYLYTAHMAMLNGDNTSSARYLQLAKQEKNLPRNVQTQIKINSYLLHLEQGFNKPIENEFMSIINRSDKQLGIYDPGIMKNQLVLYTARKMIQKDDKARGLMLLSRTNRALGELEGLGYKGVLQEIEAQATGKEYDQMLAMIGKINKTPLEKFITTGKFRSPMENYNFYEEDENTPYWSKAKVLDCKASWYIRTHQLASAYAILKQLPDSLWNKYPYKQYLGGDAFYLNIYRLHTPAKADKRSYNRKELIGHMLYLEDLAKKDKSKAGECYFQLANAWYNMTYYGKNWLMVSQWWSASDWSADPNRSEEFEEDYYGCRQAKLYYQMAMQVTKDKKLSALCFFMMEQCEGNRKDLHNVEVNDDIQAVHKASYLRAQKKGINLEYYKSIVEECEQYQSFIKQYHRQL